ncbi:rod shape-determining protein MreC [Ostreibacterium oceani]|uniref:Cell shape-determining protein MreC n=1 Tax=Ostreibacterium oceani TaxID=2654998 RepID=A0A6N7EWX2_9GAMM|nr:rod shape-determining protein MreC [Ostreibacterium oceani]MPV86423.1 rod shape-determining protein MreC [Ostreibacterium oceani]
MVKKKPRKITQTELTALTIVLLALSITLMVLDGQKRISFLRDSIQISLATPVKIASAWPATLVTSTRQYFVNKSALSQQNAELQKEVAWLKAGLANQSVLEAENRRLKQLLDSSANYNHPVQIAEVIDSFIDANKHQLEINKGTESGTSKGQVVIDENGLVGQVTEVNKQTAIVTLLSDVRQRIPVFVERNRLRMIARGSGDLNEIELAFVSKDADIRVGDKLVTSGLGGRYPRGYGIATVTQVSTNPISEFTDVRAKPLAALDRVLEVLLIAPKAEESLLDESQLEENSLEENSLEESPFEENSLEENSLETGPLDENNANQTPPTQDAGNIGNTGNTGNTDNTDNASSSQSSNISPENSRN